MRTAYPWLAILGLSVAAFGSPTYSITALTLPAGSPSGLAGYINDSGDIIGRADPGTNYSGSRLTWQSGVPSPITPPPSTFVEAYALNNADQIAAVVSSSIGIVTSNSAAVYQNGSFTYLPSPQIATAGATAQGINDKGDVVGFAFTGVDGRAAVLWHDGQPTFLDSSSAPSSQAQDINNNGEIVGTLATALGQSHVALWQNGTATYLNLPGAAQSASLNNNGDVVAVTNINFQDHSYIWQNGQATELLPLPNDTRADVRDLNDQDLAVGDSYTSFVDTHAVLWDNATAYNLNDLISPDSGWTLTFASSINNLGQIVGYGTYNGQTEPFLLTPIDNPNSTSTPDPSAGLLLALPAAAFTLLRPRRHRTSNQ